MAVRKNAANKERKITILRPCLKFLQFHYFWPKTSEELSPGVSFTITILSNMALPFALMTTAALHIAYVKTNDLNVNLDEDVVVILTVLSLFLGSLEFYLKQGQYAQVLLNLCNYKFGKPKDLERMERSLSLLTNGFYYFVVLGITLYGLIPVIEQSRCDEYFNLKQIEELCGYFIPTPPSLIPKLDLIILKPVIIIMQILCAFVALLPPAMMGLLIFEMNVHLVVHMRHLTSQMEYLSPSRDFKKELYNLVKYHQHIIEIMDSMNKCCSRGLGVYTFLTSTILGSILHQLMNLTWSTPVGPVMHITSWILVLLLNSVGGEMILNESTAISTTLYFSDWLELDQSLKKDVLLIIIRAQKPLVLKAGFGFVSLGMFTAILKGLHKLTITLVCK